MRLPKKVCFPSYPITVRLVSDEEMKSHGDPDGLWEDTTKTILIRKSLSEARRLYIFTHEVGHAFLDWQHHLLDTGGK